MDGLASAGHLRLCSRIPEELLSHCAPRLWLKVKTIEMHGTEKTCSIQREDVKEKAVYIK